MSRVTTQLKWTNSSLSALLECGERFRRRYIEREFRPSNPRQIRGRAIHEAVRLEMRRKIETGELPELEEVQQTAADTFTREWQGGVIFTKEDLEEGIGRIQARQKENSIVLSSLHRIDVAPAINPVGFERRITAKPRAMDITLEGTIDLIDGQPGGEAILDVKTKEASPQKSEADDSQQFTFYGMLRLMEVGALPSSFRLDVLVRTAKRLETKYVPLTTTRDLTDITSLVDRLNVAVEAVDRGTFLPAPASSWLCDPRYCEFFSDCRYVRRGARPQS